MLLKSNLFLFRLVDWCILIIKTKQRKTLIVTNLMNQEILKVENLSVNYGEDKILSNLSFSLNKGETLVVLGPNGAGKSTLFKALLDLIPHTGTVTWGSKKINYLPSQEMLTRKDLPPLTVEEFFKFKNVTTKQIEKVFEEVNLDKKYLKKQFSELSTGQFQRMTIAWSMVDNPEILLFDEPTSGIDIGGEETIYTLLHKFWEEKNLTILIITHDINIVWEHASKVLCLNKKQLCMGSPNEVLTPEGLKKLYGTGLKYYKHHHK